MKRTTDELVTNVLKAELMLSDYTLATENEEKKVVIDLLDNYIERLADPRASLIFNQICDTTDELSKDLYIDILFDIIKTIKAENDIRFTAWTEKNVENVIAI